MDVSVFNTLISTTDSDNPFGITPAPAPAPKNTVSTGEAFLNILNQVRNGKTEKSSEAVFSTLTSRAETSANAKKIGTSDNASQNVRVIKVHLKRTRSSSTLAKAEAQPAEKPQEKQSLPSMETAQPSEQSPSSVALTADNTVKQSDFEQKTVEKITEQPADLPTDATAADILLFAALPVEKPVETEQAESFAPVKADDAAPVEQSAPDKTTDILPSQVPEQTESAPRQTERAPEQIKQQPVQFAEKQETPVPVQTAEKPVANPVIKRETAQNEPERQAEIPPEQIETVPVEAAENTVKAQPVKTEIKAVKADTKTMRIQPLQTETAEIADAPDEAAPEHFERAQKQAEKLAKELPADTKIALTVETQTAQPAVALKTASALPAEHKEARAPAKAQAETEQAESFALLTAESSAPQKAPAAQPTPRAAPAQQQEQQQQIRQNDAFQPLFAPVQSAAQNVEAAETAPVSAAVSAVSNTAAAQPAVFTAPNELKGKAVSAPVVSQKQTPVNDLVDQIKVKITKAFKDGTDKIEIILRPKELGTIRVRLETDKDGKTTVHLTASRAETIDMLQRDVSALKQALNDAGLNTSDQAFTFNYRGEEQQNSSHEQKTASFLHNEVQAESETQDSPEDFGNHALNIRV